MELTNNQTNQEPVNNPADQPAVPPNGGNQPEPEAQPGKPTPGVDMQEAERIAQDRAERAAKAALRSILEQHGTPANEIKAHLEAFAQEQKAKSDALQDVKVKDETLSVMQKQLDELTAAQQKAMETVNQRLIQAEATALAASLGVPQTKMTYLFKLAADDLAAVTVDDSGAVDQKAIEDAFSKVLDGLPELKGTEPKQEKRTGVTPKTPDLGLEQDDFVKGFMKG